MPRPEQMEQLARRLTSALGAQLREFPLALELREGVIYVVLRGAAGSVSALRGLREKLQPALKPLLRELSLSPRFATHDAAEGGDLVVRVELP